MIRNGARRYVRRLREAVVDACDAFVASAPERDDASAAASSKQADAFAARLLAAGDASDAPGADARTRFVEARTAWLGAARTAAAAGAGVEDALAGAALALTRTVVDFDRLFAPDGGALGAAAARILARARAHGGAAPPLAAVAFAAEEAATTAAARDWTKHAVALARDLAQDLLRPGGAGGAPTPRLVALRDALAATCDGRSAAWRRACARFFSETRAAPATVSSEYEKSLMSAPRVDATIFGVEDCRDDALWRGLVGADACADDGATPLDRDVAALCSPWRAAFAPAFAARAGGVRSSPKVRRDRLERRREFDGIPRRSSVDGVAAPPRAPRGYSRGGRV